MFLVQNQSQCCEHLLSTLHLPLSGQSRAFLNSLGVINFEHRVHHSGFRVHTSAITVVAHSQVPITPGQGEAEVAGGSTQFLNAVFNRGLLTIVRNCTYLILSEYK